MELKNHQILLWVLVIIALCFGVLSFVSQRVSPNTSSASSIKAPVITEGAAVKIQECREDQIIVCYFKVASSSTLTSIKYYIDGQFWIDVPAYPYEPGVNNFQAGMPLDLTKGAHTFQVSVIDGAGNKATDSIQFKKTSSAVPGK